MQKLLMAGKQGRFSIVNEERLWIEEVSLQVDYLGSTLLSLLLLPCLVDTGKEFGSTSRLVTVASDVRYQFVIGRICRKMSWDKLTRSRRSAAQVIGILCELYSIHGARWLPTNVKVHERSLQRDQA